MSVRPCRYCSAAYPLNDAQDCEWAHSEMSESLDALATAMARIFQNPNPSDAQIGYFMEDAQAVIDCMEERTDTWKLRRLPFEPDGVFAAKFRINNVTYVIEDAEGHCSPVRLSDYRQWQREAERDARGVGA